MNQQTTNNVILGSLVIILLLIIYILHNQYHMDSEVKAYKSADLNNQTSQFNQITKSFALNHQYNDSYNCKNYSEDLKFILDSLGYESVEITGCPTSPYYDNRSINKSVKCHRFLRVTLDFEPQKGEFVDYSEKYPYRVRR